MGGLISDSHGNLYGTTLEGGEYTCEFIGVGGGPVDMPYKCGEVFELSPPVPPSTTWGFNYVHGFKGPYFGDGYNPSGALVFDVSGNLYGTTQQGGAASLQGGTVFQMVPPSVPRGKWTENVLYSFQSQSDGMFPEGGLTMAPNGVMYGTTSNNPGGTGSVFSLTPNGGGGYAFQTLYQFTGGADGGNPVSRPIIDSSGNLYGTTQRGGVYSGAYQGGPLCPNGPGSNCGTVYELSPPVPPSTTWTETVLYSFGNITFSGNPPQPVLWDGAEPTTELTMDTHGNLYGTTSTGGTYTSGPSVAVAYGIVFKLTPQTGGGWAESILYNFTGCNVTSDGDNSSPVIFGSGGLYGNSNGNGCYGQYGPGGGLFSITGN
jgi:hypothetical protein